MTEKEFDSEIANAFAKGYNVGVETERQIRDEKERYSVNGMDILIMCYQELLTVTSLPQRDTEFGKGMQRAFNDIISTLYQKLSQPKVISDEAYMKLAEKLKESCYVWNEDKKKGEKK